MAFMLIWWFWALLPPLLYWSPPQQIPFLLFSSLLSQAKNLSSLPFPLTDSLLSLPPSFSLLLLTMPNSLFFNPFSSNPFFPLLSFCLLLDFTSPYRPGHIPPIDIRSKFLYRFPCLPLVSIICLSLAFLVSLPLSSFFFIN